MSQTEQSPSSDEVNQKKESLQTNVNSLLNLVGKSLSPGIMGFIAEEMGMTKDEAGSWDLPTFLNSMDEYTERKSRERMFLVHTVFGDLFEGLSELDEEVKKDVAIIIDLLQQTYDDVMQSIQTRDSESVSEIFGEEIPFFEDVSLWRKASFLSRVAYVYQRSPEARINQLAWLKKASVPNDDLAIEEGLSETYKAFMNGTYDL